MGNCQCWNLDPKTSLMHHGKPKVLLPNVCSVVFIRFHRLIYAQVCLVLTRLASVPITQRLALLQPIPTKPPTQQTCFQWLPPILLHTLQIFSSSNLHRSFPSWVIGKISKVQQRALMSFIKCLQSVRRWMVWQEIEIQWKIWSKSSNQSRPSRDFFVHSSKLVDEMRNICILMHWCRYSSWPVVWKWDLHGLPWHRIYRIGAYSVN